MVSISRPVLLCFACFILPSFALADSIPAESPSAVPDLICSPTDATDCYPRVLVPTKDFQIIREGQDIPPGLHVRLNIYTGEREARLNIPMEGEDGLEAILDLPTEQSVLIVDQPEKEPSSEEPHIPANAPAYDSAGAIPPPLPSGDDYGTFQKSLVAIKLSTSPQALDTALDDLKELSHDIYYGLEISKDGPVLEKLICLLLGSSSEKNPASENGRDKKAASIIGNSLQNNPTALKEAGKYWKTIMYPSCPTSSKEKETWSLKPKNFVTILRNRLDQETDPAALKVKITAISNLLRESSIRDNFVANGGMELLLAVFLKNPEIKEFDGVRMKVGQLVTDNFLDEHIGAKLGVFPKRRLVTEKKICQTDKSRMLEDGCWEVHVEGFLEKNGEIGWAEEFLVHLREERGKFGKTGTRKAKDEL